MFVKNLDELKSIWSCVAGGDATHEDVKEFFPDFESLIHWFGDECFFPGIDQVDVQISVWMRACYRLLAHDISYVELFGHSQSFTGLTGEYLGDCGSVWKMRDSNCLNWVFSKEPGDSLFNVELVTANEGIASEFFADKVSFIRDKDYKAQQESLHDVEYLNSLAEMKKQVDSNIRESTLGAERPDQSLINVSMNLSPSQLMKVIEVLVGLEEAGASPVKLTEPSAGKLAINED